jgi:hypothetical protein
MQTLLGCPLRFALVRANAVPEPRAMNLMKLQSGTLTPILSNPGFKDRSRALDSPAIFKHTIIHYIGYLKYNQRFIEEILYKGIEEI